MRSVGFFSNRNTTWSAQILFHQNEYCNRSGRVLPPEVGLEFLAQLRLQVWSSLDFLRVLGGTPAPLAANFCFSRACASEGHGHSSTKRIVEQGSQLPTDRGFQVMEGESHSVPDINGITTYNTTVCGHRSNHRCPRRMRTRIVDTRNVTPPFSPSPFNKVLPTEVRATQTQHIENQSILKNISQLKCMTGDETLRRLQNHLGCCPGSPPSSLPSFLYTTTP